MQRGDNNVILFPTLQRKLERESLQALEQRKYSVALSKIDELFSYQVYIHELIVGKLICFIELGHYEEAESLCEDLLQNKNEHYYDYLHIYLTILFQMQKYNILINQIELELKDNLLPFEMREQFKQLKNMAKQMNLDFMNDQSIKLINELYEAVEEKDYKRQWQLVESLRKMKINPPKVIITYLGEENIHPVVKTAIFKWLVDKKIAADIFVHKFDVEVRVKPLHFTNIRDDNIMKEIISVINDIEQNNPSLFILLEQLLYRYLYVCYPILPSREDIPYIAEALTHIGQQYLHLDDDQNLSSKVVTYLNEIKMYEKLYLGIIEE